MKIQSLPGDVVAELLHYLADHDSWQGLGQTLGGDFSLEDAKAALRELAVQLRQEEERATEEKGTNDLKKFLSPEARHLISALSPREEKKLLKVFGLPQV